MRFGLWAGIAIAAPLWAQPAAPLPAQPQAQPAVVNTGEPIRVPFQCTNEDMDWAGMSCSEEEPCPVYLELAAVEAVGSRIFLAGNIHSSASTLYSVLLGSDDAGKTWRERYDRMRGTVLDHIQFIDLETGWVSGQVLVPVAQNPFLLITSDGGKTWRKRPVFREDRAGTITAFHFSSRTAGSLLIDRSHSGEDGKYELYESMTGGDTWMLREVNDNPIRMRDAPVLNPDWRLRADSRSRSFRIERREGEKWVNLASFLVAVGACKPAAPAETTSDPPPASEAQPTPAAAPQRPPSLKRPPR